MAGNAITVSTPVRRPHLGGLLSVANVLDVGNDSRLAAGGILNWEANACGLMLAAPGMCEPPLDWPTADKTGFDSESWGEGGIAFPGYYGAECFYGPNDNSVQRATQGVQDSEGVFLDQALNTYILSKAPSGAADSADLATALGLADASLAVDYPVGLGVLLVNRQTANTMWAKRLINDADPDGSGLMYTITGTPVVPLSVPVADTTMTNKIFAAGAPTVERTPIHTYDGQDLEHNKHLTIAERAYAIYFDCVAPKSYGATAA